MQKKWKQTGAALLIAGLTVSGTSYAWADEKAAEPIDLSQLGKEATTDAVENTPGTVEVPKEKSVNKETVSDIKKENEKVDRATVVVNYDLPKIP